MAYIRRYESWEEYLTQVRQPVVHGECGNSGSSQTGGDKWTGTRSFAEAMDLAENGWDSIRLDISQLTDQITDDLKMAMVDTFTSQFAVAGQTVDIGRYLGGEPENMVTVMPIKVAIVGRVVTILVNSFYSSSVDTEDIKRRGVAICGLVECLNIMQHETEIYYEVTVNESNTHTTLVKLKSAGESLDIGRLMFAIAHPAAFRRIWFKYAETLPVAEQRVIKAYYGTPAKCVCEDEVEANINLPILKHGFSDSVQWVRDWLFKFGLLEEG